MGSQGEATLGLMGTLRSFHQTTKTGPGFLSKPFFDAPQPRILA